MADLTHPKLVPLIVVAVIVVAAVWLSASIFRWRRITWRDHMDTQITSDPRDARDSGPWAIWKTFTQHDTVTQPSLVLVRIRNSGFRSVSPADMKRPLTFTFPGRVVKEFTVTDCRGVTRQMIQPPGDLSSPPAAENRIALPRFPMKRKAGFKLLVLLSGAGRGIVVKGQLRRGSVIHESRVRGPLAMNVAFGCVLLLLVGVQAGFTFGQSPSQPSYCAGGRLALEGSTAFAPTAGKIGSAYTSACRGASISVSATATFNGLNAVQESGSAAEQASAATSGTTQVAMSDGPAPAGYPSLVPHAIAVIIFAAVVNRDTNVFSLTTGQLKGVFDGTVTNWKQVGGADLPVKIVARTTGSGTRRAFDTYILGGNEPAASSYDCVRKNAIPDAKVTKCEVSDTDTLLSRVDSVPGAIGYAQISDAATSNSANVKTIAINGWDPSFGDVESGSYPFWTVEYLYTEGKPAPGSVTADFLTYMTGTEADDILRSSEYTPCVDGSESLLGSLCKER